MLLRWKQSRTSETGGIKHACPLEYRIVDNAEGARGPNANQLFEHSASLRTSWGRWREASLAYCNTLPQYVPKKNHENS
jgi:hypothetical protein